MEYGIAYKDKEGNGFSKTEPWILDDYGSTKEMCIEKSEEMKEEGYKNVIPFQYEKQKHETYTWEYIKKNRLIMN